MSVRDWINTSWAIFFAIWVAWGITSKRTARRQSRQSRVAVLATLTLAFLFLLSSAVRIGPLGWRFLSDSTASAGIAVLLTALGFGIAIWARLHLGGNWSPNVTIKQNHTLIQTGPYAFVRHPIYSGISMAAAGLVVLNGDLGSLAAFALLLLRWRTKFRMEEDFMTQQFGDRYLEYKRNVKALVPYLW
jgi:protein-S-isoprenylcysteine O-methyltransferase Ste14